MPTSRSVRPQRGVRIGILAIAAALVAACVSSPSSSPQPTPAPTPSPSRALASPTNPPGSPTVPSVSPNVTGWISAGTLTLEYDDARLVALAGGGAIVMGYTIDRTTDTFDRTLLETELWDPGTNGWQSSGGLELLTSEYAVTGLADGRLLLVGGTDHDASSADAYVLDPSTAAWHEVGSMAHDRSHPAAALLPDGRVLVVGGYHDAPELEARASRVTIASWAGPNADDGFSLFDVYAPPRGRALATAEVFDPDTRTWAATGAMRYARTGPAITVLADGRVLVVGSTDDNVHIDDGAYRTAEIYDPATGRFNLAGALPRLDRSDVSGVTLPDGPPRPGLLGSLIALPDGGAALIGRQEYWNRTGEVVRSFRMSGDGTSWRGIAPPFGQIYGGETSPTLSRLEATVASLPDGSVLVAGGSLPGIWQWDEITFPRAVERYDPGADAWSELPSMPEGRVGPLGVRLSDGSVMLVGGYVRVGSGYEAQRAWAPDAFRFVPGP